jgi:hypothetical protein
MKTFILVLLTLFSLSAQAQTADVQKSDNNSEIITADLLISVPMLGNIYIKKSDEKLQEDLKPLTIMKVVNDSDEINFYYEESIIAESEKKEI